MRRVIAVAVACAASVAALAAAPSHAADPITRTVYVTVVDDKGAPVPGLVPDDFGVKESGKVAEIISVTPPSEKMRLALMVEYPLAGQNHVRTGLAAFISRMCPSAEISLFLIQQRAEQVVEYTSNASRLIDGIINLPLSSGRISAAVPDAVFEVAKQITKSRHPRPVIVLLALEQGQETEMDLEGILVEVAKSRAQYWSVSLQQAGYAATGARIHSIRDVAVRTQVIGDGPLQSGGRRVPILSLSGFETGLMQVADDLSSQYLITYALPAGTKTSDRISVSLNKPGATLRAPRRVPK